MEVYSGNEPYIFVSYAHKDAKIVVPILEKMQAEGFRLWYDKGIEAGTEWPQYIAEHLAESSCVMVFMSSHSADSHNCRNEINLASELKKEMLVVYLEDFEMALGLRLQLNLSQALYKTRFSKDSEFCDALCKAKILQEFKNSPASKSVNNKPSEKNIKKRKISKAGIIIAVAVLLLVCVIILFPKGNTHEDFSDDHQTDTTEKAEVITEKAEVIVEPFVEDTEFSGDIFDYTFKLKEEVYTLPCEYSLFKENGWVISDSGVTENDMIMANSNKQFNMIKDGTKIYVYAINLSGNAKTIKDCKIGGIDIKRSGVMDVSDFILVKGISVESPVSHINAAYGVANTTNEYDDYTNLKYSQGINREVFFSIHTDGTTKYNYVSVKNFVSDESDVTETSKEVPEYLAEYVAPTELGNDILSGNIEIDGDVYHFPAPMSEFTDNGWSVVQQPSSLGAGNTESVTLKRNDKKISVSIINLALYQTIPDNCAVYKIFVYNNDETPVSLPGNISSGSTKKDVDKIVTDKLKYYESSSSYYYDDYDVGFNLSIYLDEKTNKVRTINLSNKNWNY